MIRNVVFDMGNVMRFFRPEHYIERLGLESEADRALLLKHVFRCVEWVLLDWGALDETGLEAAVLPRLPERLHDSARQLIHHWYETVEPVPGMAELARDCKAAGLGVYLLSNASFRLRDYWPTIPGSEYFDGMVISAELHWIKPMPEIYRHLLEKYHLRAEECLFIDDLPLNVSGALQVGMQAVVFDGDVGALRRAIFGPVNPDDLRIEVYTRDRLPDVLDFERRLRAEEDVWGWEIDEAYERSVERSFDDRRFDAAISLLAYEGGAVVGRIDAAIVPSRFDGSRKAYLDWICVLRSRRHRGVGQHLLEALRARLKGEGVNTLVALTAANEDAQRFYSSIPNSQMRDVGIWIDIR